MPAPVGAKLIARDRNKNKDKRRRKIKATNNTHRNQGEVLRINN